ncbi:hypothetical protein [Actinokineospora iranica]|uniref:Uncharacterized protein n=1 Tax=Actinokineospora iranica TaxID=1271860 RepID=A0A1G6REW1_9PSEU|nr:hypothetical protein [Actinokineospora iranica]SDD03200.1 hypothetical protein SAMN05216174_106317 [Actinokineospora iranica]
MNVLVPYITRWSGEDTAPFRIVARRNGIGYADETLGERDSRGILWTRTPSRHGQGKPVFGQIHGPRQRRAMRNLLCQVCAGPADQSTDGVLWILQDQRADWPGWPNRMGVTEPPICLPCAELSARLCPALRRGRVLVRAGAHPLAGVLGTQYRPRLGTPVKTETGLVTFDSPHIRWTLAAQLFRELDNCTILETP